MRKLFAAFTLALSLAVPATAFAIDTGLSSTATAAFGSSMTSGENAKLSYFIGNNIIKPVFGLIGVIFFMLMVYAGMLWMTAQGDPKKVEKAKDILITSVIGAVIVAASYILTNAVFNAITLGDVNGA